MKQLMHVLVNKYLFWRKPGIAALEYCVSQNGKCFSTLKAIRKTPLEVPKNSVLNSRQWENFHVEKRFSSNERSTDMLMNFDVWVCPKLSCSIRFLYNLHFLVKRLDESFSILEFSESSMKALKVVTILLSKLKFNELEELLTPRCKEEVERKLQSWSKPQLEILSINLEINCISTPCDILVFSDEKDEAKKSVEIRVIHYVWLPYSAASHWGELYNHKIDQPDMENSSKNWYICGVFNSNFVRDYYQDITSQWKISAINLKLFPHLRLLY